MALLGHSGSQTSQLMQSSVIIKAMSSPQNQLISRGRSNGLRLLLTGLLCRFSRFESVAKAFFEGLGNFWSHKLADIAPERSDLPDQGRGHERQMIGRGQEQAFDAGCQLAVHICQLELVFEVGDGA